MDLNFQMTPLTKLLIAALAVVLVIAVATQWGPGVYRLIFDPVIETKRQTLQTSKDLVAASKNLKPVKTGLYKDTGLADGDEESTIFDGHHPETVIRQKLDTIAKRAGIRQNYQLNTKPLPGKKSQRVSLQARQNLVVYLYQDQLTAERDALKAELEALEAEREAELETEEEAFDAMMNAWLNEMDVDDETAKEAEKPDENAPQSEDAPTPETDTGDETSEKAEKPDENAPLPDKAATPKNDWEFAALPEVIPIPIRIELIEFVMPMLKRYLVGAENTLFEKHLFKTQTASTPGFFGIGAKKSTVKINFHPDSVILAKFTELIDMHSEELKTEELTAALLEYLNQVQQQIDELSKQLNLAPATYSPESYIVEMKFKAEMEKLVNLNRLIETTTKWLIVRDLEISKDKKQNIINVDVLMIARVYQ